MKIQIDDTVRDATADETTRIELIQADSATVESLTEQHAANAASARTKLAALGLTDDEINALLGA